MTIQKSERPELAPPASLSVADEVLSPLDLTVLSALDLDPERGVEPAAPASADPAGSEVGAGRHVLIIVQNLPVPLDRRVWLECQALTAAGYEVSVICPKGPGDPSRQVIDGVHIYKYRPAPAARGALGFLIEFGYSWLRTALLSTVVAARQPLDVIQACNPPDTYWALARLWRRRGVKFVFDQHDLNPELFVSRFGAPTGTAQRLQFLLLRWLERMTYRTAHRVISTNHSYRRIALRRGRLCPGDVAVVRSGPDTDAMRPVYPDRAGATVESGGRPFELVYLGIMGPQDGVDVILDVMHELVDRRGRSDIHATLLGFGDCLEELRRRCTELGLDDHVTFTGRADKAMIAEYLSAADVGLGPDLKTPLNDVSTMNKTMEYMAYALPSVAFDLTETKVSGADSVLYVRSGDVAGFADAVERLRDDPRLRVRMALRARRRVVAELDWRPQARTYVSVIGEVVGQPALPEPDVDAVQPPAAVFDDHGRRYVDLTDEFALARFVLERGRPGGTR